MNKCKDCKYVSMSSYEWKGQQVNTASCNLSHKIIDANAEHNCGFFNLDLTIYDICYNCKYYGGGNDWGLFCSHEDNYHHLGSFRDEPCQHYKKKSKKKEK